MAVEKSSARSGLAEVIDRILDKGVAPTGEEKPFARLDPARCLRVSLAGALPRSRASPRFSG